MLTLQEILDIACRHLTPMADAMVRACVQRAQDTGERIREPTRPRPTTKSIDSYEIDFDDVDWERLMRENSDTRWNHC